MSVARVFLSERTPVLSSESLSKFDALRKNFRDDIKPQDAIERMYCDDIATLVWEAMRWRRIRDATLNVAMRDALYQLLVEKLSQYEGGQETVSDLDGWFTDSKVKRDILKVLEKFNLDESAIEAEAFAKCSSDMAQLEQLLASTDMRRDRALHNIALYRRVLAQDLRRKVTDTLQSEKLLRLESKG